MPQSSTDCFCRYCVSSATRWGKIFYRCKMAFFRRAWHKVKVLSHPWALGFKLALIRSLKWGTLRSRTPGGSTLHYGLWSLGRGSVSKIAPFLMFFDPRALIWIKYGWKGVPGIWQVLVIGIIKDSIVRILHEKLKSEGRKFIN